ncbi:MAG: hypothetical protein IKU61_06650 [Clostridia bacterium]|nr:hypothetical protein [Clostridia bacterium]
MNWKYVKLLLILLLIAVNILLASLIFDYYSESAFTDGETAEKVSAILKENGIFADASDIAVKNDSAKDYTSPFSREDYLLSVAAFLLGENPSGVFLTPDGIRAENSVGETAYVYNDMQISYAASGIDADAVLGKPITDEEEANAVREEFALILGYPTEDLDGITMLRHDDVYVMTLMQKEDGIPLFGYECTFAIRDKKIVFASGKHFFGAFEESEEAPLLNRANILLSEKNREIRGTVTDVSLCYVLYEDTKQGEIRLAPAYKVTYGEGHTSIIDAKSADLFE